MSRKAKKTKAPGFNRVKAGHGPCCHRCGHRTTKWRWDDFRARAAKVSTFVYAYWFACYNKNCRTTLIMPPEAQYSRDDAAEAVAPPPAHRGHHEPRQLCLLTEAAYAQEHFRSILAET